MKYHGTFGAFNSYIDVGDGYWRRSMLVTDLTNLVNILHLFISFSHQLLVTIIPNMSPRSLFHHQYLENVTNVDIGHIHGDQLTTGDCP